MVVPAHGSHRPSLRGGHGGHRIARWQTLSVCTPFIADQFFWADRMRRLGVAPESGSHASWTVETLSGTLETALNDMAMRTRAEQISTAIRAEDGLARAVVAIEKAGHH